MTRVYNEPADFAREATEGLVAANRELLRLVPGGVTRAAATAPGQVAVVIGGGSGHYPAFSGLVGRGLAHGAVVGNVFASPSAQQICSVARTAQAGAGVLFSYGNYAGDVLHFGAAAERLAAEGIEVRQVLVTDDVSSAAPDELSLRRGVAGDLVVFKVAGAAADRGLPLAEVARLAGLANEQTRSFGVAFAGCTLPGADEPLFTVPPGRMGVGMGVHGEPGIGEADLPSADELARQLVSRLLEEVPAGLGDPSGQRAAVLLNGLGAVKYEELFVLYRRVDALLAEAGVDVVEPEVGELITSLDMAGVSLTVCWLTDELAELWHAPADAAGFRKGTPPPFDPAAPAAATPAAGAARPAAAEPETSQLDPAASATVTPVPPASAASRAAARVVAAAFEAAERVLDANAAELGRIDAVAGDGDHGEAMGRGSAAAAATTAALIEQGAGAGTALARAGAAWSDASGGASGALWEVGLCALGTAIGDEAPPSPALLVEAVGTWCAQVMRVGGAAVGDKTMVDVLVPFAAALAARVDAGLPFGRAWNEAVAVAEEAAAATAGLAPRIGRARPLAARSVGHQDAGATSLALLLRAVEPVIRQSCPAPTDNPADQ
ncbi:MAG TPA: dihydroxyacetone kinase family protein [Trebonia sp.]|jgi:dihydroxyacetone kinase|nr:dihydroxyacetone kinase family protein [Trebonia sp.]